MVAKETRAEAEYAAEEICEIIASCEDENVKVTKIIWSGNEITDKAIRETLKANGFGKYIKVSPLSRQSFQKHHDTLMQGIKFFISEGAERLER
jgi:hypothetical protein